jgi:hypothetical protein
VRLRLRNLKFEIGHLGPGAWVLGTGFWALGAGCQVLGALRAYGSDAISPSKSANGHFKSEISNFKSPPEVVL